MENAVDKGHRNRDNRTEQMKAIKLPLFFWLSS